MEENRLYQALRLERSRGGRTVSKQTRVLRVTISADNRRLLKIKQMKENKTADEVTEEALTAYFLEHPV